MSRQRPCGPGPDVQNAQSENQPPQVGLLASLDAVENVLRRFFRHPFKAGQLLQSEVVKIGRVLL